MKDQLLSLENLKSIPLEFLSMLWEQGCLSEEMKDYVITRIPILQLVRKKELEAIAKRALLN